MTNNLGVPQITDEHTQDAINGALDAATAFGFPDMQRAFERVSKVLMVNNIFLHKIESLADEEGLDVSPVTQGVTPTELHIYFEWQREDNGLFSVFCNIVDDSDLEELLNNSDHLDSLPDWEDQPSQSYGETQKKWANKQLSEVSDYKLVAQMNDPAKFAKPEDLATASSSMVDQATTEAHPKLKNMYLDIAKNLIDKGTRKLAEEAPPGAKYERMIQHIKSNLSQDGSLSKKDEAKAFGSAWKAYKKDH